MRSFRYFRTTLTIGVSLAALPVAAGAAPSYLGPSGYILTPDATVTPGSCVNGGFHVFANDLGPDFSTLAGNYGIADRFEVGASFFNVHGGGDTAFWVNAKASVLPPDQPFQLAGGVIDLLDESDLAAYVVGTFNAGEEIDSELLPRSLRVGAGWGTGNFIDGVFINGGLALGGIQFLGEWICRPNFVNLAGRYQTGGWTLDLAGMNLTRNAFPALGASYTHCFGRERPDDDEPEEYEPEKGEPGKGDTMQKGVKNPARTRVARGR